MRFLQFLLIISLFLLFVGCSSAGSSSAGDPPPQLVENIENKGSDTMVNLALAWAEEYQSIYPAVSISVTGGGSGTGIAALINNTVDIANASRAIKPEEIASMHEVGVDPHEFVVARDAIAIIVNHANPIDELTLEQISAIYRGDINNWRQLGGDDRPVVRLSRETNSGTHVYFLENVLRLGEKDSTVLFSPDTLLLPSSEGITAEVRDNPNAIGYDGLGYVTDDVKVLAVAVNDESTYVLPSIESVINSTYPIARDLYMYTAREPKSGIKAYLDWIYGPDAQEIVGELGFVPVFTP